MTIEDERILRLSVVNLFPETIACFREFLCIKYYMIIPVFLEKAQELCYNQFKQKVKITFLFYHFSDSFARTVQSKLRCLPSFHYKQGGLA